MKQLANLENTGELQQWVCNPQRPGRFVEVIDDYRQYWVVCIQYGMISIIHVYFQWICRYEIHIYRGYQYKVIKKNTWLYFADLLQPIPNDFLLYSYYIT